MVDRTIAAPARATTLAVVVTCGVTPYLGRTLAAVAAQSHHPGVVLLVDVAAPGRDIGTGEPLLEAVQRSGLEDVTHVRLVTTPEAATFGAAVSAGLEAYGQLVERAARRAVRREASLGGPVTTGSATGRSSFRLATGEMRAVTDGVLDAGAASYPDWLWLLHDDSAPGPHALDRQLRAAEAGRSLAVVGAKQVDWDEPDRLLEVGVLATRRARRVPDIEPREIDQGQHDHRQDVLAVGTAGMLVGATVWDELGGTDPVLGPFGDGLELSRRVRAAGYRVVVEPTAHVLHRRASYLGLRDAGDGGVRVVHPEDQAALDEAALDAAGPDAGARDARAEGAAAPDTEAPDGEALDPLGGPRPTHGGNPARSFAARRSAQLYNALVAARAGPLLALGYVLLGPLRAIWRMLGKDTPLAVGELVAVGRLVPRLGAVGRARRRVSSVGRAPRAALRELESGPADVRAARSTIRRQIATSRRLAEAPSELELAERADLARRRRLTLGLVVLVAFTIALPFVLPLVGGGQPVGGALAHLGRSAEELWTTARSTWTDAGVGHPGPADPLLTLTAAASWLLGLVGLSPGWVATLAVLLAVPASALTAWAASGAATRTLLLRAVAALAWALSPALWMSLGQGRLGAVLAHAALPLVALGIAWLGGSRRRDVIRSGLVGARRTGQDGGPLTEDDVDQVVGRPRRTTRAGAITGAAGAGLALALAAAGAPILLPAAVVALVLLAPLVPRRRGLLLLVPVPAIALLAPSIATALARGPLSLAVADPGHGLASDPGPAWLTLLGLPRDLAGGAPTSPLDVLDLPWRELLALLPGVLLVVLALLALFRLGRARAVRAGWLLVAVGVATAVVTTRVPGGTGDGVEVTGWAGPGVSVVLLGLLVAVTTGADAIPESLRSSAVGWRQGVGLVGAVALLTSGGAPTAVERLAQHAVGVVVLDPEPLDGATGADRDGLVARLATVPGLEQVSDDENGTVLRLSREPEVEGAASSVARARLVDAEDATSAGAAGLEATDVPAGAIGVETDLEAAGADRVLVLAETAHDGWEASLDGTPLEAQEVGWQQAFAVPAGASGELEVAHREPWSGWMGAVQAVVLGVVALLALPLRVRREEEW